MKLGKKPAPENPHISQYEKCEIGEKLAPKKVTVRKNRRRDFLLWLELPPCNFCLGLNEEVSWNLVRMTEMILNQQESWQRWRSWGKEWNLERKVVVWNLVRILSSQSCWSCTPGSLLNFGEKAGQGDRWGKSQSWWNENHNDNGCDSHTKKCLLDVWIQMFARRLKMFTGKWRGNVCHMFQDKCLKIFSNVCRQMFAGYLKMFRMFARCLTMFRKVCQMF